MKGAQEPDVELESWFEGYCGKFTQLASDMRANTSAILDYYAAPARIVGLNSDKVMLSPDAIMGYGGVGAELEDLRRGGFVDAAITDLSINLVNPRAAIIEATWKRSFLTGKSDSINRVYIVTRCPFGWRIIMVIEKS